MLVVPVPEALAKPMILPVMVSGVVSMSYPEMPTLAPPQAIRSVLLQVQVPYTQLAQPPVVLLSVFMLTLQMPLASRITTLGLLMP